MYMHKTAMNTDAFISFSAVQIYDLPYIHLNTLFMLTTVSSY